MMASKYSFLMSYQILGVFRSFYSLFYFWQNTTTCSGVVCAGMLRVVIP